MFQVVTGDLLTPEYSLEEIINQLPEWHRARQEYGELVVGQHRGTLCDSLKKVQNTRPRDICFEVLAELHGGCSGLTSSARGAINKALKEIRQVCPQVTEEEIKRRICHHRKKWPNIDCTATSLSKHWALLAEPPSNDYRSNRGIHYGQRAAKATSDNSIFADAESKP